MTDPETIGLSEVALSAWELVALETATLRVDLPSRRVIVGDRTWVSTLFENLFVNAFRHVGPDVTLMLGSVPGGFYLEDDGCGIDASLREGVVQAGRVGEAGQGRTGAGSGGVDSGSPRVDGRAHRRGDGRCPVRVHRRQVTDRGLGRGSNPGVPRPDDVLSRGGSAVRSRRDACAAASG